MNSSNYLVKYVPRGAMWLSIIRYLIVFSFLYLVGVFNFLGSTDLLMFSHYLVLISVVLFYVCKIPLKQQLTTLPGVFLFCFVFPVLASYQSYTIFGQPIIMGVLSLRYGLYLLLAYMLVFVKVDYHRFLLVINRFNIAVIMLTLILFYIFDVDHMQIDQYMTSTNLIEITPDEDQVRGKKLGILSDMMFVSYIYYLLSLIKNPHRWKSWLVFILLVFYLIFVNKSRQNFAAVALIYLVYYLRSGAMLKKIAMFGLPILLLWSLSYIEPAFVEKFSVIFGGIDSEDSSTWARFADIEAVWPYIQDHYLCGVGNLSVHFNNRGFQYFFGSHFYISDIGLIGALFKGGIFLLFIYFILYKGFYNKIALIENCEVRDFLVNSLLFLIFVSFIGRDYLNEANPYILAFTFYPLFCPDPNKLVRNKRFYNYR